jgi:exonuclease VII large subunit
VSLVELAVSLVVAVVATLGGAWGLLSWFQHRNESYVDKTEARLTASSTQLKHEVTTAITDLRADLDTRSNEHRADTVGLRHELKSSLAELKTDLTRSVDTLRSDVRPLASRLDTVISQQAESARGLYSMGERLQAELSHSLQEIRSEQRQADERLATLWAERQARR